MKKGKKKNSKGFTLVELLASLVILGLLAIIAAPNIIGILQRTKLNTYIDDSKKLATLAQYRFRADSNITRPTKDKCIVMTLKYLGNSEFKNSPYGSKGYDQDRSFVLIKRVDNSYKYYVQLVELVDSSYYGIRTVDVDNLKKENKFDYIKTNISSSSVVSFASSSQKYATDMNDGKVCQNVITEYYNGTDN